MPWDNGAHNSSTLRWLIGLAGGVVVGVAAVVGIAVGARVYFRVWARAWESLLSKQEPIQMEMYRRVVMLC